MDFIETSALSGKHVEVCFRRVFLSVARKLPDVAMHLELSFLPEGWMVCTRQLTEEEEEEQDQLHEGTTAKHRASIMAFQSSSCSAAEAERQTSVGVPSTISSTLSTVGRRTFTIGSPSEASISTTKLYSSLSSAITQQGATDVGSSSRQEQQEQQEQFGSASGEADVGDDKASISSGETSATANCSINPPSPNGFDKYADNKLKGSVELSQVSSSKSIPQQQRTISTCSRSKFDRANMIVLKSNSNEERELARLTRLERVESDRRYINYWTGELVNTLPQAPAIVPGLLYNADSVETVDTQPATESRENLPYAAEVKESKKDQDDFETSAT